jgi:NTP pyrophosphatase (non-canonical NTP hydrolase)
MMNKRFEEVYKLNEVFRRKKLEPLGDLMAKSEQEKLKNQFALVEEEEGELWEAIERGDWNEMKDAVIDILVTVLGIGYIMNIDCDEGLKEVNRANFSKLCKTQEQVQQTVEYYNKLGIETSVSHNTLDDEDVFLIKSSCEQRDKDGKVYPKGKFLKNVDWIEPDLGFIELP